MFNSDQNWTIRIKPDKVRRPKEQIFQKWKKKKKNRWELEARDVSRLKIEKRGENEKLSTIFIASII